MSLKARSAASVGPRLLGALIALGMGAVAGCGVDGQTPSCGEYPPPFDVQSAQGRATALEALASSAGPPYYCTTLPAGFSLGGGGATGASGAGGAAGGVAEAAGGEGGDSEMSGAGAGAE